MSFLFVSREERQCSPRFLQRISGSARCEFWRDPKEFFEGCDLGAARSSRSVEEGAKQDAGLWAVCFLFNENTSCFLHSHSLRGFQPRRIHWANVKIFCDKTKDVAICAGIICIYHKNNYICEASESSVYFIQRSKNKNTRVFNRKCFLEVKPSVKG